MLIYDGRVLRDCNGLYRCGRSIVNKDGVVRSYVNDKVAKMVMRAIIYSITQGNKIMMIPQKDNYLNFTECVLDAKTGEEILSEFPLT